MRNVYLRCFSLLTMVASFQLLLAQTGPGGVGNSTNNSLWLKSSTISQGDGTSVSAWSDQSGNSRNAIQANGSFQPTYRLNQINGFAAVEFNGTNSALNVSSNITTTDITTFMVVSSNAASFEVPFHTDSNIYISDNAVFGMGSNNPWKPNTIPLTSGSFTIFSGSSSTLTGNQALRVGNQSRTRTFNDQISRDTSTIGAFYSKSGASYSFHADMSLAELITYDEVLNSAQRKIVGNYLGAKYNLTAEQTIYSYRSTHPNDVMGIGQESDGSQLTSRGIDSLMIANASSLGNGDYFMVGHNGADFSTSTAVGADMEGRWNRVWRADVTGTPGTVDLTFYLGNDDFATIKSNYVLLIESNDGDFSNGGTNFISAGMVYDGVNKTVSFTGVSLNDGNYFTLAEQIDLSSLSTFTINYGPGGVGNTTTISSWLDASSLTLSNNASVTLWDDQSGNNNFASQSNGSFAPLYKTNQINGQPSVEFNGTNSALRFTNNITAESITSFMILSHNANTLEVPLHTDSNIYISNSNQIGMGSNNNWKENYISQTNNTFNIFSGTSNKSSGNQILSSGNSSTERSFNQQISRDASTVGAFYRVSDGSYSFHAEMNLAELLIFNRALNGAERKIVSNALASKYGLTGEGNLFAYASTHGNGVIGVGQESDGSHTSSRDLNDSLLISSPSALGNGDYIMVGHNNLGFTTTASGNNSYVEAWDRIWRVDVTGTPGTIDLEFFLGSNGFSAILNYAIIVDSDGDFSSGAAVHSTGRSYNAANNSISFTGISFTDGDYFTLAEVSSESTAQDGDWGTAATWACNCIPGSTENAVINHDVTINSNQSILDLTIASGGNLAIASNQTLSIHGDMVIDGTFASATGTIEAVDASGAQTFDNSSSNIIDIYNLVVNNNSGLTVQSGGWAIQNNLQVSAGGMNVSSADSVVLYSDASSTAQILPSMSNAFTGDFTIRRYISKRSSRYSNQSSPITNGTVADLDDDLYLSGVGGNDADVLTGGGQTFRSVQRVDPNPYTVVPLTTTASALEQGRGYEVYLDASKGFIPPTTIDYVGTPTSGSVSYPVDQGWNLIGNPYQSFIDFGAITSSGLSTTYYIYNTSTRSWNALNSSTPIAPGQGFYVNKTTAGIANVTFDENDKVSSNSSSFLRRKSLENDFTLSLTSLDNQFSHQMQLKFDPMSSNSLEQNDASYLISPEEKAPAIYAKPVGMNKKLVINALSSWDESHKIPVEIYAGVEGKYNITSENMTSIYDNYECVYLYDREEKQTIDLSVEQSYEFTSDKGTHERFDIVVSNSATHCMDMIKSDVMVQNIQDFVNLRNAYNHWFIDYQFDNEDIRQLEVNVYNMNGQQVVAPNNISVSGTGNYKIEGLNELKGIYLIQIKSNNEVFTQTISL